MVMNQVTAKAEPNVSAVFVRLAYCLHLATVIGEWYGWNNADVSIRNTFGPFTREEAHTFIVSAMTGSADLPFDLPVHSAQMFVENDDYEESILEEWPTNTFVGSKCSTFEEHEAGEG